MMWPSKFRDPWCRNRNCVNPLILMLKPWWLYWISLLWCQILYNQYKGFISFSFTAFYGNTEISNLYLTKSSPKSQYHNLMYYSKTIYMCWHYLTDAVRWGRRERHMVLSEKASYLCNIPYSEQLHSVFKEPSLQGY